jgi:hypothetical protein
MNARRYFMRNRTTPGIAITVALTAIVLTTVPASAASAVNASPAGAASVSQAMSCTSWQIVTAPQPPGFGGPPPESVYSALDDFTGVSVLSGNDVWIGGESSGLTMTPESWFVHWNGQSAATASGPSLIPQAAPAVSIPPGNYPPSSSFDSDTDGWQLMGLFDNSQSGSISYDMSTAEHWHDGRWVLTPMAVSPDPGTEGIETDSVAAVSPADAWAVGGLYANNVLFGVTSDGALIEHWDGTAWSIVPNPALNQPGAVLRSVSVVSPSDIWAVGQQGNPDQVTYSGDTPLIEHWNGTSWTVVTAPAASTPSFLFAVSGDSATDAWAVGYQTEVGTSTLIPLVEHWDGTSWTTVTLPASVAGVDGLIGVYAASPDNVWAIQGGFSAPLTPGGRPATFLHWDGTTWSAVSGPGPRAYGLAYQYEAISGDRSGDVWAVGAQFSSYTDDFTPLIARLSCVPAAGNS